MKFRYGGSNFLLRAPELYGFSCNVRTVLAELAILLLTVFGPRSLWAQDMPAPMQSVEVPNGEPIVSQTKVSSGGDVIPVTATSRRVYSSHRHSKGGTSHTSVGRALADIDYKRVREKAGENSTKVFVLQSNGNILQWNAELGSFTLYSNGSSSSPTWEDVQGDDVYLLSFNAFVVTRDSGATWQADTAGLGSAYFNAMTLDSSQYVYLAASTGIFKQHPDSNVWHHLSSYPGGGANGIYVDRKNRVYASTYGAVYMSTDGGVTWHINSSGLGGGLVKSFGDDAFNNVYALVNGMVVRSDSGTAAWVRIDTSISNKIKDPVNSYSSPYIDVEGDTVIYLATNYGLFASTDQGMTWTEANDGIQATTLYGFVNSSTRRFVSTALGLYYENQGDTAWTKAFPANGYAAGGSIYTDNGGNLYTLGPVMNINNSQSPPSNWKSTDNGATWLPDTMGLGVAAQSSVPIYFADENGVQHYSFDGAPAAVYKKSSGSSWIPDTAGLGLLSQTYPNVFASDKRGSLYWAITTTTPNYAGLLYKRPIAGGTWLPDTAGLQGAIVYSITPDKNGNLYAGTYGGGIYKKTGNTWSGFSTPNGLGGSSAFVTTVDSSGALWAGFSTLNGFNFLWHGIYYTTDNGSSWTYAGLDSISVRALIVYGDSVYAVTYNDGLYVLTKNGGTNGVRTATSTPNTFALLQNYPNPFNPTTVIRFSIPQRERISLIVYDILGREVATLVNGDLEAGPHQATFDASKLASGIYLYRLKAGTFTATKKLVLLK
jgi:Secretion system C-terminal sorting domain/Two component regulator propeller